MKTYTEKEVKELCKETFYFGHSETYHEENCGEMCYCDILNHGIFKKEENSEKRFNLFYKKIKNELKRKNK